MRRGGCPAARQPAMGWGEWQAAAAHGRPAWEAERSTAGVQARWPPTHLLHVAGEAAQELGRGRVARKRYGALRGSGSGAAKQSATPAGGARVQAVAGGAGQAASTASVGEHRSWGPHLQRAHGLSAPRLVCPDTRPQTRELRTPATRQPSEPTHLQRAHGLAPAQRVQQRGLAGAGGAARGRAGVGWCSGRERGGGTPARACQQGAPTREPEGLQGDGRVPRQAPERGGRATAAAHPQPRSQPPAAASLQCNTQAHAARRAAHRRPVSAGCRPRQPARSRQRPRPIRPPPSRGLMAAPGRQHRTSNQSTSGHAQRRPHPMSAPISPGLRYPLTPSSSFSFSFLFCELTTVYVMSCRGGERERRGREGRRAWDARRARPCVEAAGGRRRPHSRRRHMRRRAPQAAASRAGRCTCLEGHLQAHGQELLAQRGARMFQGSTVGLAVDGLALLHIGDG